MKRADAGPLGRSASETHIVGTSVASEVEKLLDRVGAIAGRRTLRVLQVGSRVLVSDRKVRNWRSVVSKRFKHVRFFGIDLEEGTNVDRTVDICSAPRVLRAALGEEGFDLVLCCHVLEHTPDPWRAAHNIESLLRPGGFAYVCAAWSQAFHATPDDYWRFSVRGLMRLFDRLEVVTAFYSGGAVGMDVAYRVERNGQPLLEPRAGAIEKGLFQVVLDHEDNRAMLTRQATERLPVSRTYMPVLFVNLIGKRRFK